MRTFPARGTNLNASANVQPACRPRVLARIRSRSIMLSSLDPFGGNWEA